MLLDRARERDERCPVGKRDDPRHDTEELRQKRSGEGLPGGSVGEDAPLREENGAVGPGGELQLVRRKKDRRARRRPAPERVEDDEPVPRVEARRRLVEEHHLGIPGEDSGQKDTLTFAAAHLAKVGLGEGLGVQLREGSAGDREVGRSGRRKPTPVGYPTEKNGIESTHREERLEALREIPDPACRLAAGRRLERPVAQEDGPRARTKKPREELQDVVFPAPFSPRRATTDPRGTPRVMPCSTSRAP